MARILISEPMDAPAVEMLRARHEVVYGPTLVDDMPALLAAAPGCHAFIVRNRTQVRGALLDALKDCRVVGRLGVGMDNIDMDACVARGIEVFPATGANALSVAEYVIASSMVLLRGAYFATPQVIAGQWPRAAHSYGRETAGKALGIIGFGSIGQTVGRLALGLGMKVLAHDAGLPPGHPAFAQNGVMRVGLDDLLRASDVVTLHVPLLDSTRRLMNAPRIAMMKKGSVLINTARGPVVDADAVAAALKGGQLAGAALDVFDDEPLPAAPMFEGCANLILTPHISGQTAESNDRVCSMVAARVLEALG